MKKILILLSLVFIVSCGDIEQEHYDWKGKLFQFNVEVTNAPTTSIENKADVPYNEGEFEVTLEITAEDFYGDTVKDIKNSLRIYTPTGTCKPSIIEASSFVNGKATITVSVLKTYGTSYIVVEDLEGNIGVSDEEKKFFFEGLDVYDLQVPSSESATAANYYNDNYVRVSQNTHKDGNGHNIGNGNLMVLHSSGSGMYIIDLDRLDVDGTGTDSKDGIKTGDNTGACMIKSGDTWVNNPDFIGYSTVYVYSRNAPVNYDGDSSVGAGEEDFKYLRAGHKLDWFSGNLVEFPPGISNGMTELGFPIWEMIKDEMELPESTLDARMKYIPICKLEHDDFVIKGNSAQVKNLEKYESNIVAIKDVVIGDFDADNRDYKIYSQWQVYPTGTDPNLSNKPTFRVVSITGASEFDLLFENGTIGKGTEISEIKGILHHVYDHLWVIYLRDKCDIRLKDDNLGGWNDMIDNSPECNK